MNSWQDELDLYAEILGLDDAEYRKLVAPAKRNSKLQGTVRRLLRRRLLEQGINPDDLPACSLPRDLSPSDYPLGYAKCGELVGKEIGFSEEDLLGGGIGIFGISGVGKTTLVKILLLVFSGKKL